MKFTLLAALLALFSASASAQSLYTTVSLDGHKTFSDRADTNLEPAAQETPKNAARRTPSGTMAKGSRGATLVNSNEAERRLVQIQQKRRQGMAPLPGESARVPGGVQVNSRYWNRQEKLRIEVEQAQRRMNETQRLQLAQR